mmetsp:Transcript_30542/g.73749  ORF Transcript_30542/g.73749 Transcript_30542/m.73749 type:complete len:256 (+) Transcript_30542:149-916(+)
MKRSTLSALSRSGTSKNNPPLAIAIVGTLLILLRVSREAQYRSGPVCWEALLLLSSSREEGLFLRGSSLTLATTATGTLRWRCPRLRATLRVLGGILRRRNLTRVPTPQRSPPPPAARRRTPPSSFPSARSPPLEGGPSSHVGHNRRSGLWTSVTGAGLRGGGRHNRRATTLHFHCPLNSAHPSSSSSRCPPHIIPPPAHHSCCLQLAARSINGVRRTPRPLMLAPMCSAADATNAAAAASSFYSLFIIICGGVG